MKTDLKNYFPANKNQFMATEFEDAVNNSTLLYSLRNLTFSKNVPQENTMQALEKSLHVCYLVGINSKHHFKKIYVFDVKTQTLYIDWMMSKKGFNLMVMQTPLLNKEMALWLWELANL